MINAPAGVQPPAGVIYEEIALAHRLEHMLGLITSVHAPGNEIKAVCVVIYLWHR